MSRVGRDTRQIALAEAFSEMGQAWIRWVHACVSDDAVSYARVRVLTALEGDPDGLTMSGIAAALGVTGRRVTVLVDALVDDGLVLGTPIPPTGAAPSSKSPRPAWPISARYGNSINALSPSHSTASPTKTNCGY